MTTHRARDRYGGAVAGDAAYCDLRIRRLFGQLPGDHTANGFGRVACSFHTACVRNEDIAFSVDLYMLKRGRSPSRGQDAVLNVFPDRDGKRVAGTNRIRTDKAAVLEIRAKTKRRNDSSYAGDVVCDGHDMRIAFLFDRPRVELLLGWASAGQPTGTKRNNSRYQDQVLGPIRFFCCHCPSTVHGIMIHFPKVSVTWTKFPEKGPSGHLTTLNCCRGAAVPRSRA